MISINLPLSLTVQSLSNISDYGKPYSIRSLRFGNDWTQAELDAYNITVVSEDAATFFGVPALPQPHLDQEFLDTRDAKDMTNDKNAELIHLLDLAMAEASAVVDFAVDLLKALGYAKRHHVPPTRRDIPLRICGERRHAKTDACIGDYSLNNEIMLLVQMDKRFSGSEAAYSDAEAQLVAGAISAFTYNNTLRVSASLPAYESKIIPGIVMVGTAPIFYKINVASQLEYSVRHGLYPSSTTQVSKHQPNIPRPHHRWSEGMKPVDTRKEIMKCYKAFKAIVGI